MTTSGVYFCNKPNGYYTTLLRFFKGFSGSALSDCPNPDLTINLSEMRAYSYIPLGDPTSTVSYQWFTSVTPTDCSSTDLLTFKVGVN